MIRDLKALWRSVRIYRLNRSHQQSLRELYQPFVSEGSVVFDIGAHAGDRTACFKALGATVVSIEPQPWFARLLKLNHLLSSKVTVLRCVVSDTDGPKVLRVNSRNPTVSTLSDDFVQAATDGGVGWQGQQWDRRITVPAVTVDALIARFGMPAFIKIDVEGAELDVLSGLSSPPSALSFEFTMIQPKLVVDCIERCATLGLSRFNVSLGESHQLTFETWLDAAALIEYLSTLPPEANSGDVYARREV